MTTGNDICAICLANAQARGGEFLVSPGCCGKWFHQTCIVEMQASGKNFCPACRTPFPAPAAAPAPVAAPVPPAPVFALPPPPVVQQRPVQQRASFTPTAPAPAAAAPTGIFSRIFSSRRPSNPTNAAPASLFSSERNDLTEDEISSEPVKKPEKADPVKPEASSSSSGDNNHLTITLSPEFTEEALNEKHPFHVRVSTLFNQVTTTTTGEEKTDLDIVCVLDNSGSMSGSKIDNLKAAMEFVITTLGERDRLSVVTFNSDATPIQGLWKMTEDRKGASRNIVRRITAGGGTDIYRGMQQGWNMLQQRRTRNPASCMFLLTDGQDGSNLEEKKRLAKLMREQGTSLFVFGFGNDHDSAHLIQIANAAEGSFVYVETNDTVIDAFGGAIGTQQGQLLRDIRINLTAISPEVRIEAIQAGSYLSAIHADHRQATVNFADLYGGERRDFLVQLRLPSIPAPQDLYQLLSVQAQYRQHGTESLEYQSNAVQCSIRRVPTEIYNQTTHERDVEVDAQIQRLDVTSAMKSAMELADRSNYEEARQLLTQTKNRIENSVAYRGKHVMSEALLDDLKDCEKKVGSRVDYESHGGRAFMTENVSMHTKQRAVYSKKAAAPMSYQSSVSRAQQSEAVNFKNARK